MKELDLLIALTKALPDPVLLLDGHGQVLAANTTAGILLGYTAVELRVSTWISW